MDVLNEDCWRHIFQYLSAKDKLSFSRISPQCQDLIARTWESVKFVISTRDYAESPVEKLHTEDVLQLIQLMGHRIKDIELKTYPNQDGYYLLKKWITLDIQNFVIEIGEEKTDPLNACIGELCKYAIKVNSLLLLIEDYNKYNYSYLLSSFRELKSLSIFSSKGSERKHLNAFNIGNIPTTVDELALYYVYRNSDILIPVLERLKSLYLGVYCMEYSKIQEIFDLVFKFAKQLKTLKVLSDTKNYRVQVSSSIDYHLPSLEKLYLCHINSDETFLTITRNCVNVKSLELVCSNISENTLAAAVKICKNVEYLALYYCTNIFKLVIADELVQLNKLKIFGCGEVVQSFTDVISKMPALTFLDISSNLITANFVKKILDIFVSRCQKVIFNNHYKNADKKFCPVVCQLIIEMKHQQTIADLKTQSFSEIHLRNVQDFSSVEDYARKTLRNHIISTLIKEE